MHPIKSFVLNVCKASFIANIHASSLVVGLFLIIIFNFEKNSSIGFSIGEYAALNKRVTLDPTFFLTRLA